MFSADSPLGPNTTLFREASTFGAKEPELVLSELDRRPLPEAILNGT